MPDLYPAYTMKLARRAGYMLAGRASSMFARCLLDVCSTFARCLLDACYALYPVYTIKQTSSNHRANIQQMHLKYTCTTCALIARCLLDRVNGVLISSTD